VAEVIILWAEMLYIDYCMGCGAEKTSTAEYRIAFFHCTQTNNYYSHRYIKSNLWQYNRNTDVI